MYNLNMKTWFWIIIAVAYFLLAVLGYIFNSKIDKVYMKSKDDFKKDYGFNTYGIFELVGRYTRLSTIVNFLGFILASAAAILSI